MEINNRMTEKELVHIYLYVAGTESQLFKIKNK